MSNRIVAGLVALALALAGLAMAADPAAKTVTEAIHRLAPQASVSEVRKAPLPGFYQALVGGRLVYVSADGGYVVDGSVFDTHGRNNLTATAMRGIRAQALAAVPASQRLIFAPPHPRYTVTVFTDLDCGYCREFHKHIKQINAEGIAVEYLFWPRTGLQAVPSGKPTPSYEKAVAVWCAKDRHQAFTAAKLGVAPKPAHCENPVAREYHLGERIGVSGTPTIIASDGTVLGGYLDPQQLLQALRQLDGPASGGAAGKHDAAP